MSGTTTPTDEPAAAAPAATAAPAAAPPAPEVAQPAPPVAQPSPETTTVAPHTETATLLEGVTTEPPAPDAAAAADAAAATEPPPAAEPVTPVYEPFTLPEGITAEPERLAAYTETLGKFGVSQEAGQALIDMHAAQMQQYATHLASEQHRVFAETRKGWRDQVMADEEIGGAGHQTAMAAVARMRDLLVPERNRGAFNEFLRVTGAGDHPEFLRLMHSAARAFDEPAIPAAPHRPPPNNGMPPRGTRGAVYDHPSSQRLAGSNR